MLADLDLDLSGAEQAGARLFQGHDAEARARGCLLRADLLVLDEPTSGLDPKARALLKARLQEAQRDRPHRVLHLARARRCRGNVRPHGGDARGRTALRRHACGSCAASSTAATLEQAFLRCIDSDAACRRNSMTRSGLIWHNTNWRMQRNLRVPATMDDHTAQTRSADRRRRSADHRYAELRAQQGLQRLRRGFARAGEKPAAPARHAAGSWRWSISACRRRRTAPTKASG